MSDPTEEVTTVGKVQFRKLDEDTSWRVFDRAAHRHLKLSGEEFARRWDEGWYEGRETVDVMKVVMLRPSGR